jgi:hypothetical protein
MTNKRISYIIEQQTPLKLYIFDFLFFILGIKGELVKDIRKKNVDIYYGNQCPSEKNVSLIIAEASQNIICLEMIVGKFTAKDVGKVLEFDIINAISLLIRDQVNSVMTDKAYDIHDRLRFENSFQANFHLDNIPLTNVYVNFILDLIEYKCQCVRLPLWPKGKTCAIGLSHDVDDPEKYSSLKVPFFIKSKSINWHIRNVLSKIKNGGKYLLDNDRNDYWLFDNIMNLEEKHGFKSTFFFASMTSFGKYGSDFDVKYDIENIKFRNVFDRILNWGFEIGLHASYSAYKSIDRFRYEKHKLERVSKSNIAGLRHHFWHMGRDYHKTLMLHESAGFKYDSSIAFDEHMGFRTNIALPFFHWNEESSRRVDVMQLPVFCMDGNLFYHPIEVDMAIDTLKSFISIIKKFGGMGVIDWHVRTSYPINSKYRKWGECYVRLMEYLSDDDTIWVSSLGNIYNWLKDRRKSA